MNWRNITLWLVMLLFIGGLYWLRQTHMMRVDFNTFFGLLIAMSAAVVIIAWVIKPVAGGGDAGDDGQENN